jgi:hypothetical protein
MWPGSRLAFFDHLRAPKFEDYEIVYESGNRWGYLGNGFTVEEFNGSDIAYYLDERYLRDEMVGVPRLEGRFGDEEGAKAVGRGAEVVRPQVPEVAKPRNAVDVQLGNGDVLTGVPAAVVA